MEVGDGYWALNSLSGEIQVLPKDGGPARPLTFSGVGEPLLLGPAPGGAAVYDGGSQSLSVIRQGKARATISLDNLVFFPKTVLAVDDTTVILAAGIGGSTSSIHIFRSGDAAGSANLLALPEASRAIVSRTIAGGVLASDGDGVLFAQSAPHLIARLDVERAVLDTIVSDPTVLPAIGDAFHEQSGQGTTRSRWFFPQARGVGRLPVGRIFHLIRNQEEGLSIWEVYEADGALVARTTVDRAHDVWGVLADGTLLASRFTEGPSSLPVRLGISVGGEGAASHP